MLRRFFAPVGCVACWNEWEEVGLFADMIRLLESRSSMRSHCTISRLRPRPLDHLYSEGEGCRDA